MSLHLRFFWRRIAVVVVVFLCVCVLDLHANLLVLQRFPDGIRDALVFYLSIIIMHYTILILHIECKYLKVIL